MPVAPTYPGVYIEELPSGVRTIVGVATSVAAFIDFFKRGPMNRAVQILGMADFEREFGGLDVRSEASYAVQQFYANGGTEAWLVRVAAGTPSKARGLLQSAIAGPTALTLDAANEGLWGNNLIVKVDYDTTDPANRFNLSIAELGTVNGRSVVLQQETFRNLSMSPLLPGTTIPDPNYVETLINERSRLVSVVTPLGGFRPLPSGTVSGALTINNVAPLNPTPGQTLLQVNVTFTIGAATDTRLASLGAGAIVSLEEAAARLESAIHNANPSNPAWAQATVRAVGSQLQIVAGPSAPNAIITFTSPGAGVDTTTVAGLALPTAPGAATNAGFYQLGSPAVVNSAQGGGTAGSDGTPPDATALIGSRAIDPPTGMFALEKVEIFNIMCLPRIARADGTSAFPAVQVDTVVSTATNYCEERRAFLVLDPPSDRLNITRIRDWVTSKASLRHKNVALYFPRVMISDPLSDFRLRSFGASGTMAGIYARTDASRGVWKAPAGTEATLRGVTQLEFKMTDPENGVLNPQAVNCLRTFDVYGNVAWGARTLDGSDQRASEWKYVPVRRLALFLEESLYQGTQWVVFEPNDEPLWSQIRLNIGAFMHNLFRQGAFQGQTPKEAYLVKCDKETTTQNDINLGIVNILVGFAPLKPAEFVIIKIQQLAGQIQT